MNRINIAYIMSSLVTWQEDLDAISALEQGKIIFFPNSSFSLNEEEKKFLNPNSIDLSVKSVKYNLKQNKLWGISKDFRDSALMEKMINRYAKFALNLVNETFPFYKENIEIGNTSFRPVEASGRIQSKRQDDTRLHTDAFPSRPTKGNRLLRVFANVNIEGKPRVWNTGEPFEMIAQKFAPLISKPLPLSATVMKALKLTKDYRTEYDHYMLNIHDKMKLSEEYQKNSPKENIEFPAGSVWIVFSDSTSHAALSGKGLLEQTLYLHTDKMQNPKYSPLIILEKILKRKLI